MSFDAFRLMIIMQPLTIAACFTGFGFSLGYFLRAVLSPPAVAK